MDKYNTQHEAILAIQLLDHSEIEDTEIRETYVKNRSLPVTSEVLVKFCELVYAKRDELPEDFIEVAIKCTAFCVLNGLGGLQVANRGLKIIQALLRDYGAPGDYPEPEEDPEILAEFNKTATDISMPVPMPPVE